jgi:hypothetical protein
MASWLGMMGGKVAPACPAGNATGDARVRCLTDRGHAADRERECAIAPGRTAAPPASDGTRIAALRWSASAKRDRAQTVSRHQRNSPGREGKPAGWPAPAV